VLDSLKDKYYKPVLVGKATEKIIKGSARSVTGINIIDLLKTQADKLINYGGHEKAAGFSLNKKDFNKFKIELISLVNKIIVKNKIKQTIKVDIKTGFHNINLQLAKNLFKLEPYGQGNPQPLFMTEKVKVISNRIVGKTGRHNSNAMFHKINGLVC